MIKFELLNKSDFLSISNEIYNIFAHNMSNIAPTDKLREEDYKIWYEAVSDGLQKDARQIILIKDNENIIGFFQYYTNADTFMMEEIQFKPEYQGKGVFRKLYGFVFSNIRTDIKFVEAYTHINNFKSIGILQKFGFSNIGFAMNGSLYHFKGEFEDLVKWYENK